MSQLIIRQLGQQAYEPCWQLMQAFTSARTSSTADEFWLLEHDAVFTQGQAGKPEHILQQTTIPIVKADRGGQVTYHGPGQLILYLLLDLRRLKINVRELVTHMEQAIIDLLAEYQINAYAKCDAPGVYVSEAKIASLGLRVRKGCTFHGLALNVDLDLAPFSMINPCGYQGLTMVRSADLNGPQTVHEAAPRLAELLARRLAYQHIDYTHELPSIHHDE